MPANSATAAPSSAVPAGIRTFLIADIRGYTTYTQEQGDEAAARLASQFAEAVEQVVPSYDGQLLELRGDEALVVFTSARQALRAAVALQQAFVKPGPGRSSIPVGIGLDAGEAVAVRDGFRGAALNVAARLCSLAAGGEALATPEVVHLASRVEGIRFRPYKEVQLKGLPDPVRVVAVEAAEPGAPPTAPSPSTQRAVRRTLRHPSQGSDRRRRALLATVVGAVLVVTVLAWGPWLPPAEQTSSEGPRALAEAPLRAVLLFGSDFPPPGNGIGHFYMFPAGDVRPADYPPVGVRSRPVAREWEERHGGVPVIFQTVRLQLEGSTREPVLITRIDPRVVVRKPPLRGWYVVPEAGGGSTVRYVETNLDCPEPRAVVVGGNKPARQDPVTALDLEVSRFDKEQLEITAYSPRSYVRWGLDITYVFDGTVQTLRVDDPRLQVTPQIPGIRAYAAPPRTGALVRIRYADPTRADTAFWEKETAKLCRA